MKPLLVYGRRWLVALVLAGAFTAPLVDAQPGAPSAPRVPIAAADFVMGTDSSEIPSLLTRYNTTHPDLFTGEAPRRAIHLRAFTIDRVEVTNEQFRAFLIANPAWRAGAVPPASHNGQYLRGWSGTEFPAGEGTLPMAFVTWPAARAFCMWAGGRLPTEAEWEYAARGGLANPEFPWGDEPPDSTRSNYGGRLGGTSPAGRFPANGYGLFDMAGNVWEYVEDLWAPVPAGSPSSALEPAAVRHVIRGGSFEGAPLNLRVKYRDSHPAGGAAAHVGFRCAE